MAVREGHCTHAQVGVRLTIQQEPQPNPIDEMLRDPELDQKSMLRALSGYVHYLEESLYVHRH